MDSPFIYLFDNSMVVVSPELECTIEASPA